MGLTVLNVRRLLERGRLDEREAVLNKVFVRNAYPCLYAFLCFGELLVLRS